MVPYLAALHLDSQLRKARGNPYQLIPLPMNGMLVYIVTYVSIWIVEKNRSNTTSQGLKVFFSKWIFTNRSYYKAGNLETVHFLTKLNILLKSTFVYFSFILKVKKIE